MDDNSFKTHQCTALPQKGVDIMYSRDSVEGFFNEWSLLITRESTELDLEENHHLEVVGETIWETILEISHCPFCGELLSQNGSVSKGAFLHRNYF